MAAVGMGDGSFNSIEDVMPGVSYSGGGKVGVLQSFELSIRIKCQSALQDIEDRMAEHGF
jgi:hypothetical protein